jgi:hypothetical protein
MSIKFILLCDSTQSDTECLTFENWRVSNYIVGYIHRDYLLYTIVLKVKTKDIVKQYESN